MSFKSTTTVEQQPDGTVTITATTVVTPGASSGEEKELGLDLLPPADPWAEYFATLTPTPPPARPDTEVGEGVINIFDPVRNTRDGYIRCKAASATAFDEHWVLMDPAHLYCSKYILVELNTTVPTLNTTVAEAHAEFDPGFTNARVSQFHIARQRANYANAPTNGANIPNELDVVPPGHDIRIYDLGTVPVNQLSATPTITGRMYQDISPNGSIHEVWFLKSTYQPPDASFAVAVQRLPGPSGAAGVNPGHADPNRDLAAPLPVTTSLKAFFINCITLFGSAGAKVADASYTWGRLGPSDPT